VAVQTKSFLYGVGADCRIRHFHQQSKNQVLRFVVQLEVRVAGAWHPVVRYDTAHGFAHRDQLHYKGTTEKSPLAVETLAQALTVAERDLRENWEHYREGFLEEVKRHESK
jgi:hypothetical protein